MAVATIVVLIVTASAVSAGRFDVNLQAMSESGGVGGVVPRIRRVYRWLVLPGPEMAAQTASVAPAMRLADYLHACLPPGDRALVTGYRPEAFYFADRGFAGGHVDVRAGYSKPERDQQLTISRLESQRAPMVVTDARAAFEERDRPEWPLVFAYLDREYVEAGERDFGGEAYRVLLRRDLTASGTYAPLGLPCLGTGTP